ncbi:MAG: stage III sporulation protein AB [Candidatus Limivicinus sp.]|jgi:stage III sporulation protein AB
MKVIGSIMAFAACSLFGIIKVRTAAVHLSALRSVINGFDIMRAQLSVTAEPICFLMEYMADRSDEYSAGFFQTVLDNFESVGEKSFSEVWEQAVKEALAILNKDERENIARLGGCLGSSELSFQLSAIESCTSLLRKKLAELEQDFPQQKKLSLGLSMAAGMMIVIILI